MPSPRTQLDPTAETEISWEIEVPLLTNRDVVGSTFAAFALTALIAGSLVGMLLAAQGEWSAILPIFGVLGLIAGGLF